jgi:hypothetical protein
MLIEFMSPGLVQLHALQYAQEALRVQRETPVAPPHRRLRKAMRRFFRATVRRLTSAVEKPSAPALHGCG